MRKSIVNRPIKGVIMTDTNTAALRAALADIDAQAEARAQPVRDIADVVDKDKAAEFGY